VTDDHDREMSFRMLSDQEYEMTRVFDAPRELVFAAYTDPTQIPRWWGPRGVTTIVVTRRNCTPVVSSVAYSIRGCVYCVSAASASSEFSDVRFQRRCFLAAALLALTVAGPA
jgi:hypothetical protein